MDPEPAAVGDEGFADDDLNDDDAMEAEAVNESDDEVLQGPRASVYFCDLDPDKQGHDISREEVELMMKSEPYQKKIDTCHLCGKCWYDNQWTAGLESAEVSLSPGPVLSVWVAVTSCGREMSKCRTVSTRPTGTECVDSLTT